ncbi:hypothetical protein [Clostridium beijerinckii]|uniref:Uncharacterized protein n=1 Tax=Clostridium beijerinckii TaxID=1520 RepID=A0AAX0AXA2_CLOBE|nr:hypothetical protein [Clostridium beijerinckii]NRT87476.1 hypothetical protein [Clostridium beijerinckii]NYC72906.1 hypothetical protein [Clostridium beijerinckii]
MLIEDKELDINLINVVEKYLKLNYSDLYNKNDLGIIFEKAKEDNELKLKIFNSIRRFIMN